MNAPHEASATDESSESDAHLGRLALRGSLAQMGGYVVTYGLRFASSTILRSLLFPAAFGIMELVNGISIGLLMLSDVGIQQVVIQSPRGNERRFLDTAWTIHIVRGFILWLIGCAIAYPASKITHSPEIVYLIPICTLGVVGMGFHSTAEFTLRRRLALGRVILMEIFAQGATVLTMITWAAVSPTVWALVAGGLVSTIVRLGCSHYLARHVGYRNRFRWDPAARREIWNFGRWITASSTVCFVGTWGDRLMLVVFLGTEVAGVYATAILMSEAACSALNALVHSVVYPIFSRLSRRGTKRLATAYYHARLLCDIFAMGSTGILCVMGPWISGLLFDERYEAAGWMLRILCLRSAVLAVTTPAETCLTSLGHSKYGFYQNLVRATCIFVGVPVGYWLGGVVGVVWVTAASSVPPLLALWPKLRALGILRLDRELLAWVFFAVGAAIGAGALWLLPDAVAIREWISGGYE